MIIKANSKEDVHRLWLKTTRVSISQKVVLISNAHFLGLMVPRNLSIRLTLWFLKRFRGYQGIFNFFTLLQRSFSKDFDDWYFDMTNHIISGRDKEDIDSVGGWSQREIDIFINRVGVSLDGIIIED